MLRNNSSSCFFTSLLTSSPFSWLTKFYRLMYLLVCKFLGAHSLQTFHIDKQVQHFNSPIWVIWIHFLINTICIWEEVDCFWEEANRYGQWNPCVPLVISSSSNSILRFLFLRVWNQTLASEILVIAFLFSCVSIQALAYCLYLHTQECCTNIHTFYLHNLCQLYWVYSVDFIF